MGILFNRRSKDLYPAHRIQLDLQDAPVNVRVHVRENQPKGRVEVDSPNQQWIRCVQVEMAGDLLIFRSVGGSNHTGTVISSGTRSVAVCGIAGHINTGDNGSSQGQGYDLVFVSFESTVEPYYVRKVSDAKGTIDLIVPIGCVYTG